MLDDHASDSRAVLRWLDAFPWVETLAGHLGEVSGSTLAWWLGPVDACGTSARSRRLANISDLALGHLARWTIGQIFPGLSDGTVLASLSLTNRARNALERFGYWTMGDLQGLELVELLDMPQVGVGTVDSILQALADATVSSAAPVILSAREEGSGFPRTGQASSHEPEPPNEPFIDDLRMIASWYAAIGMPTQPLLGPNLPPGCPLDVVKARQRLELVNASEVLAQEHAELDAAELLQRAINTLDGRAQKILAKRLFADHPETLDELGKDLGVTRERVRQIEAKARAAMIESLESESVFEALGASIRELIGAILPLADLLVQMPALARMVEAATQPAWRVFDRLDDSYEIEDGWCAAPTIQVAQTAILTRLQELANPHGVVRIDNIDALNPNQPESAARAFLRDWLIYCGCVLDGDWILTRTHSVGDRAASVLSIAGSPMTSQEILDRLGVERSLGSLRNAMGSDGRFERVDRDRWALVEWGLDAYSGIRAVIRGEVAREGGQVQMDVLIERITSKYTVSASSVIAYASASPFEARDGVVRFAMGDRDVRKGPERTRRLYRRTDAWVYRVKVTTDHLRGSGSPATVAVAAILDLQPGQSRALESALGPQTISWTGNQPAFGTIRRFLIDSDIETGTEIFLVIGDDGSFRIEPVDLDGTDPLERALRLVGVTGNSSRQPRVALAAAIRLPEDSPAASVIGGYRERGDSDIADLLLSAWDRLESAASPKASSSPDIDEILDLL